MIWAVLALFEPLKALLEELTLKARAEEDQARVAAKEDRRHTWRKRCLAESESGVRTLFRWIREGPCTLQSTGILVKPESLYAGQRALLAASGGRCGNSARARAGSESSRRGLPRVGNPGRLRRKS